VLAAAVKPDVLRSRLKSSRRYPECGWRAEEDAAIVTFESETWVFQKVNYEKMELNVNMNRKGVEEDVEASGKERENQAIKAHPCWIIFYSYTTKLVA
jgi:hypothetical protein